MTCTTAASTTLIQAEKRTDAARLSCSSPSSISDVDFSRSSTLASNKTSAAKPGEELEEPKDGMRALASGSIGINDALAHPLSSSESLKRKAVPAPDKTQEEHVTKKTKTEQLTRAEADRDDLPTDIEKDDEEERSCKFSICREDCTAVDGCERVELHSTADVHCSSASSRRCSRRTLYIEYWSRTNECKERKWDHLDEIADMYGSAEEHIFATTLKGRTAFLEPNMFPYDTPAGIEHWTLWHVEDLNHEQVKQYVESWIEANALHVERWNYDDNPERSIDIFHVHVYFQVQEGQTVLHGRKVEKLVHEFD